MYFIHTLVEVSEYKTLKKVLKSRYTCQLKEFVRLLMRKRVPVRVDPIITN